MYKFNIEFIILTDSIVFEIKAENIEFINEFVNNLFCIFGVIIEGKPTIDLLQEYNEEKAILLNDFFKSYEQNLPQINGVIAFFKKLSPNQKFFFLPNIHLQTIERLKLHVYLKADSEGKSYDDLTHETSSLFEDLLSKYDVGIVGSKRIAIGERERSKRVCRFCNNKSIPLSFKSKAHAISEALGNKTVILLDECNVCNKRFSETIEPDIIQYLSLFRTFFKVDGKGGVKKFKGKNFSLSNEEQVKLEFYNFEDRPKEPEKEYKLKLKAEQPIISQNIYKCLCKFFLSSIPQNKLCYFERTIEWVNGDFATEKLPKIAEMISYHSFSKQPKLTYYIRKNDDNNLPFAVCEFHFTCQIFVFIVPFSNMDNKKFLEKHEYNVFWKTFKHLEKYINWVFNDYSNNTPREYTMNLNFNKKEE